MRRTLLALGTLCLVVTAAHADDWPQWLGPKRDGVWRETGLLEKFPADGAKILWRTPIGAGYAGPAVAAGKVFVTDRQMAPRSKLPTSPFDDQTVIPGNERVLCLDAAKGTVLWKHEYDCPYQVSYASGPRATPAVEGEKIWTLGSMGHLKCLNTADGSVVWQKDLVKEYKAGKPPTAKSVWWGHSSSPLIDGKKLICLVGGEGSIVVAFDKDTGKELWKALSASETGYCPPMIYEAGGKRQLIVWHPDAVVSLDPETGAAYWTQDFPIKAALSIATPRKDGDHLLISSFYNGSIMLKLDTDKPGAKLVWKGAGKGEMTRLTDGLHSIMSTPVLKDGHIYGVCSFGQLRCLKADTGERIWQTFAATGGKEERWANAFLVENAGRFFLFNEKGDVIIARLSPKGYEEVSRAHVLDPDNKLALRPVIWSHPAFANKAMFARNDSSIVCVSLAAP